MNFCFSFRHAIVCSALFFNLPKSAEAMLTRTVLLDTIPIFSRAISQLPIQPLGVRTFSRYAKFDGEEQTTYITRATKLREEDDKTWQKAVALRNEYNADWEAFQEKYFPKPISSDNSHDNSIHRISYPGGEHSPQSSNNTNSFMAGYLTRDVTDFIFGKSTTKTDASTTLPGSPTSYSNNSSDSHRSSNHKSSSDWGSDGSSSSLDSDEGCSDSSDGDGGFFDD